MRFVLLGLLAAALSYATLLHIYVDQRQDVSQGKEFGAAGPYERIVAHAIFAPNTKVPIEYVKPRDPAKGNGTLVVWIGSSFKGDAMLARGYTHLRMSSKDPAAVRELISFLRYGGGPEPFLLGDQKRFLKRTVVLADAAALQSILMTNADSKNRRLVDEVIINGPKGFTPPEDVRVLPGIQALMR